MNKSEIVSLSNKNINNGYWLRVEQPDAYEPATQEEAASIIDSAFNIEPCIDSGPVQNDPVDQNEFKNIVASKSHLNICNLTYDKDYTCQVNVVVSNPDLPHKLILTNGEIVSSENIQEYRKDRLVVNQATRIEVPYPIIGSPTFLWINSSSNPIIRVNGRYLEWETETTGVILISYNTEYFKYNVTVYHEGEDVGECSAIGFYQENSDSIKLKIPYFDEEADRFKSGYCKSNTNIPDEEDKPRWVPTETKYYCECSGEYHHSTYSEEPQGLDRDNYTWPAAVNTIEVNGGYINCGEVTQDINDPEFYKQVCCDYPTFPLPRCYEYHRKKSIGKSISESDKASYTSRYGDRVKFTPVSPVDGDCGTVTVRQRKMPRNCCEGVTQLLWDYETSIEVIPNGQSGTIYAIGGIAPFTYYSGNPELLFSNGKRTITTNSRGIGVYATDNFCGNGWIQVTDGCSTSNKYEIRSDLGNWVHRKDLAQQCILPGEKANYFTIPSVGYWNAEAIVGKWRVFETQTWSTHIVNSYDVTYKLISNTVQPPLGVGVGCNAPAEGGCRDSGYYYWCSYTTCTMAETFQAHYDTCHPGNTYYPEDGDGLSGGIVCLEAGVPNDDYLPSTLVHVLRKGGRVFEIVIYTGVNSGYVCNLSNIGPYFRKRYVGRGPGGVNTWEWQC